jgi:hypothetical protein
MRDRRVEGCETNIRAEPNDHSHPRERRKTLDITEQDTAASVARLLRAGEHAWRVAGSPRRVLLVT